MPATGRCERAETSEESGQTMAELAPTAMPALRPFRLGGEDGGVRGFGGGRGFRGVLWSLSRPAVERVLAFPALNAIYDEVSQLGEEEPFTTRTLRTLGVSYDAPAQQVASIPQTGPLVVVANHPFGGIEGIILADLLRRARPDTRLLANYMLAAVPDLAEVLFYVDPFGRPDSARRNLASLRAAMQWLRGGGVLGVFPAGEVSHLTWSRRAVADPRWSDSVARLIQSSGADVLPIYFDGRNSALFQTLGLLHARLRTAMLPRELLRRRHSTVRLRIGEVIPHRTLAQMKKPQDVTAYLRVRTYILRGQCTPESAKASANPQAPSDDAEPLRRPGATTHQTPTIDPVSTDALRRDVDALPADRLLMESGDLRVLLGRATELPGVLREIGRLREITFRKVGEGTGKPLDLDRFDQTYLHLFVWNAAEHEIVGAYRLAATDDILPHDGKHGLYTSTLFRYRSALLRQIDPALELGRSFVRPEYQKEYAPLMLLWRGIGAYVARHPRYKMLFGPVSISTEYSSISRQLLIAFLTFNRYLPDLGRLIRPLNPPKRRPFRDWDERETSLAVRSVDEVNDLISQIEADRKSMPVLLRQYLKLNARLLAFNVDPDFGDVLDGLMLIDLTKVDRNVLWRYMGKDSARIFLAHHDSLSRV